MDLLFQAVFSNFWFQLYLNIPNCWARGHCIEVHKVHFLRSSSSTAFYKPLLDKGIYLEKSYLPVYHVGQTRWYRYLLWFGCVNNSNSRILLVSGALCGFSRQDTDLPPCRKPQWGDGPWRCPHFLKKGLFQVFLLFVSWCCSVYCPHISSTW